MIAPKQICCSLMPDSVYILTQLSKKVYLNFILSASSNTCLLYFQKLIFSLSRPDQNLSKSPRMETICERGESPYDGNAYPDVMLSCTVCSTHLRQRKSRRHHSNSSSSALLICIRPPVLPLRISSASARFASCILRIFSSMESFTMSLYTETVLV